ncbi:MAG: Fe-S cluster assembly protein SufD [Gammaproteobacteria bacterium]|jgi:Fe-S cluster assembly protein SufD
MSTAIENYLSQYSDQHNAFNALWLNEKKDSALKVLKDKGFPSTRVEEWRYTDINPILKRQFNFVLPPSQEISVPDLNAARISELDSYEMVFLNGRFLSDQSDLSGLSEKIKIKSLANAITENDDWIAKYLNSQLDTDKNGFIALNTAFIQDGVAILIPDNVELDKPVNIIYLTDNNDKSGACNVRNLIVLGKNSRADVIETYFGTDKNEYFTNTITEISLSDGAALNHSKLQQEAMNAYHLGYMHVGQALNSKFESNQISLGSKLSRSEIDISLSGSGAQCTLNGLYMANKSQHVDHHTRVDHLSPNTSSNETYRGVLGGRSRGVFNGKIVVHKDAQKTDAHLTNANLLLSGDAEVDTKPELEIYADDVKCSHGATVGALDENMLHYLRTRAINKDVARSLLTFAFADDVVRRINYPQIRQRLEKIIVGKLPDAELITEFVL